MDHRISALLPVIFCLPVCLWAGETPQAPEGAEAATSALTPAAPGPGEPSVEERIRKALRTELLDLDGKGHSLTELLALFARLTGEKFVLDPELPKGVGEMRITLQIQKGGSVLDAFSVVLALANLRYAIHDGGLFISTEERLMDRLLFGKGTAQAQAASKAAEPFSEIEAAVQAGRFDPEQEGFLDARDFISHEPWRRWDPPSYNPRTGLTDFPGPPVWMDSTDYSHPRFRYTTTPFYLKPEYLALEQEKAEFREEQRRQGSVKRQASAGDLVRILKLLKDNPQLKAEEILRRLEQDENP